MHFIILVKKNIMFIVAGIFIIVAGIFCVANSGCSKMDPSFGFISENNSENDLADDSNINLEVNSGINSETPEVEEQTICVYVCGAVNTPGVVFLNEGARAYDAIEAAGGLNQNASDCAINQAEKVFDGQKLYIPSFSETVSDMDSNSVSDENNNGLININTADVTLLCTLPGIGESRALAIIAYRQDFGGFKKIEDIMNISGIKDASFDKIKGLICV